jgi:hypothetical protein
MYDDEGYCGACGRLEPLDQDGLLGEHTTNFVEYGAWHLVTCRGTGTPPSPIPEEI